MYKEKNIYSLLSIVFKILNFIRKKKSMINQIQRPNNELLDIEANSFHF